MLSRREFIKCALASATAIAGLGCVKREVSTPVTTTATPTTYKDTIVLVYGRDHRLKGAETYNVAFVTF